jgi:hypothetical protein
MFTASVVKWLAFWSLSIEDSSTGPFKAKAIELVFAASR